MSREGIHQKLSEEKVNSLFYLYLFIVSVYFQNSIDDHNFDFCL